jgi:hypothetical protein
MKFNMNATKMCEEAAMTQPAKLLYSEIESYPNQPQNRISINQGKD